MTMSTAEGRNEMLTCSICTEIYDTPKVLPVCGHLFCLRCIELLFSGNTKSFVCPTCKEPSPSGPNGPKDFTTCAGIVEMISKLKMSKRDTNSVKEDEAPKEQEHFDVCNHFDAAKFEVCPHCCATFCQVCAPIHMEKLRTEILEMGRRMKEIFEPKTKELEQVLNDLEGTFQRSIVASQAEIRGGVAGIYEEVDAAFDRKKAELIEWANNAANEKMANTTAMLENALSNAAEAKKNATLISAKSVLKSSPEEFMEIFSRLDKLQQEIEQVEKLTKSDFVDHLEFNSQFAEENICGAIEEALTENCLKPELPPQTVTNNVAKLHDAAQKGDLDEVKRLLNSPGLPEDIIEHCDESNFKRTLLHQASESGNFELVRYLVEEKGAKLDAADLGLALPVQIAAANGHPDVVEFLLTKMGEVFPASKETDELLAFRFAVASGCLNVAEMMLNRNPPLLHYCSENGETWLHFSSLFNTNDQLAIVRLLIERGIDVLSVDAEGNTPLHLACKNDLLEIATFLYRQNAGLVTIKNKAGQTPLDLAIAGNFAEIVDTLTLTCETPTQLVFAI